MKNALTISLSVIMTICAAMAQGAKLTLGGSTVDPQNQPIGFTTAVLLGSDSLQVSGVVADADGKFVLSAPKGEYTFIITCIGYEDHKETISLTKNTTIKPIVLKTQTTQVDAVSVTTKFITRESDRFVINVAGSTEAIGKTGFDILKSAPGVWINNKTLSINGMSGTKVMLDEKILDLPFEELEAYLNTLNAEDIQKIEVIPTAGVEYDAGSKGGIIKITLKRQRRNGIEGSAGLSSSVDRFGNNSISPNFNINFREDKLSLYTRGGSNNYDGEKSIYIENTNIYKDSGDYIKSKSWDDVSRNSYNFRFGALYDINDKSTIGAEVSLYYRGSDETNNSFTHMYNKNNDHISSTKSIYPFTGENLNSYTTVNYINKIDTVGSQFKLILNMNMRNNKTHTLFQDYTYKPPTVRDPEEILNSDDNKTKYDLYSANADWVIKIGKLWSLKTGAKFNYNRMNSNVFNQNFTNNAWVVNTNRTIDNLYNEYIGALYLNGSTTLAKKISVGVGVRGEYTHAKPETTQNGSLFSTEQKYFKLFPSLDVSMPFDKNSNHMMSFKYSKTIDRPWFWAITPFRMQISPYTYAEGNPALKPTINHSLNITYILKQKYSLTAGMEIADGLIRQISVVDPDNPMMIGRLFKNFDTQRQYNLSLNAPLTITKWWSANINATGLNQKIVYNEITCKKNSIISNLTTTVSLPAKFSMEGRFMYYGQMYWGNTLIDPIFQVGASVKKRFANDKFTASVDVDNIFDRIGSVHAKTEEVNFTQSFFERWQSTTVKISLRYNFKAGVSFKERKVEMDNSQIDRASGGK